jgi:hypothetical protein
MNRLLLLSVAVVALCSCGRDDTLPDSQKAAFKRYLEGDKTYASNLPCDTLDDGVWRLLENPREGRKQERQVTSGSEVEIVFEGYIFTSSLNLDPSQERLPAPFYTNDPAIIAGLGAQGMTSSNLWSDEPVVARLGGGGLIKGLETGLRGAYKGDILLLLMTSANGYDNTDMGMVPKDSPLVFRVYVNDVRR